MLHAHPPSNKYMREREITGNERRPQESLLIHSSEEETEDVTLGQKGGAAKR